VFDVVFKRSAKLTIEQTESNGGYECGESSRGGVPLGED
jgi:hypothetical protein